MRTFLAMARTAKGRYSHPLIRKMVIREYLREAAGDRGIKKMLKWIPFGDYNRWLA